MESNQFYSDTTSEVSVQFHRLSLFHILDGSHNSQIV